MIIKSIATVLFCFFEFFGNAQTVSVEFSGVVSAADILTEKLEGAELIIAKGVDTLETIYANSEGTFSWKGELIAGDEITISASRKYFMTQEIKYLVSTFSSEVELNFNLSPLLINVQNTPFFDQTFSTQFTGFDIQLFKHQLRNQKNYCIEFIHISFRNESDEIAGQRMNIFKQYLIDNGIEISNLSFRPQNVRINCDTDDCRGRIEGKILSLGESCK
jgi:hypothetical protein